MDCKQLRVCCTSKMPIPGAEIVEMKKEKRKKKKEKEEELLTAIVAEHNLGSRISSKQYSCSEEKDVKRRLNTLSDAADDGSTRSNFCIALLQHWRACCETTIATSLQSQESHLLQQRGSLVALAPGLLIPHHQKNGKQRS